MLATKPVVRGDLVANSCISWFKSEIFMLVSVIAGLS